MGAADKASEKRRIAIEEQDPVSRASLVQEATGEERR